MYSPFMVKSHTIKGCMGGQKIYRIFHCLSLVMGTYTTSGNRVKNQWNHPSPMSQDVNIFGKFGAAVNVKLKPREIVNLLWVG